MVMVMMVVMYVYIYIWDMGKKFYTGHLTHKGWGFGYHPTLNKQYNIFPKMEKICEASFEQPWTQAVQIS